MSNRVKNRNRASATILTALDYKKKKNKYMSSRVIFNLKA